MSTTDWIDLYWFGFTARGGTDRAHLVLPNRRPHDVALCGVGLFHAAESVPTTATMCPKCQRIASGRPICSTCGGRGTVVAFIDQEAGMHTRRECEACGGDGTLAEVRV